MRGRGWKVAVVATVIVTALLNVDAAAQAEPGPAVGTADWLMVSSGTGESHTCGIRTDRQLYCWGLDVDEVLGNGPGRSDQATPAPIGGPTRSWRSVTTGRHHTCAITTGRRLFCWGKGDQGQLGVGPDLGTQSLPTEVAGARTNWTSVSAGLQHTCGRRATGRIYCWGDDAVGALGDDTTNNDRFVPATVAGGLTSWTSVDAGDFFTCGRRTSGVVFCWGIDNIGQLGNAEVTGPKFLPYPVRLSQPRFTSVSVGATHACARQSTGRLYCWGSDGSGRLGDGGGDQARTRPSRVAGGITNWTSVSAGAEHTCARRSTGRLYCWGQDAVGSLGDGAGGTDRATPSEVDGTRNWSSAFSAGRWVTCARRTTGRLYCWGFGADDQLGNGSPDDRFVPTEVAA